MSASGTYKLSTQGDLNIVVDETSVLGSKIQATGAETITVVGSANIAAVISGEAATSINMTVGSGNLTLGSTAALVFNLVTSEDITFGTSGNRLAKVQDMSLHIGDKTADLSPLSLVTFVL